MFIDIEKFKLLKEAGYISIRQHDLVDLLIFNYTPKCQYEPMWTEETSMCRGLITDFSGKIISRPFRKFFNLSEAKEIPDGDFKVYEKYDGSLGILYWIGDEPFIATRGSFHSEQAIKGSELIKKYDVSNLDKNYTYLFEIQLLLNSIVLNYV